MKRMIFSVLAFTISLSIFIFSCQKTETKNEILAPTEKADLVSSAKNDDPLLKALQSNVEEQFGENVTFEITEIRKEIYNEVELSYIKYKTSLGDYSFAVEAKVKNRDLRAGSSVLSRGRTYLVDCFGSCGCTEIYHTSGYFTCSCSECRMKLTETS